MLESNMNKEDYVSLEVAKLLKEKGFNEPCDWIYDTKEQCFKNSKEVNFNVTFTNSILRDNVYCVPSLYEAQKWILMRSKLLTMSFIAEPFAEPLKYLYGIQSPSFGLDNYSTIISEKEYDTYEEALNEGILEALKLI